MSLTSGKCGKQILLMWFLLLEWNRARLYGGPPRAGWAKCVEEASAALCNEAWSIQWPRWAFLLPLTINMDPFIKKKKTLAMALQYTLLRTSKQHCLPEDRRTISLWRWSVHLLTTSSNPSSATTSWAAPEATQEEEGRRLKLSFLWQSDVWD